MTEAEKTKAKPKSRLRRLLFVFWSMLLGFLILEALVRFKTETKRGREQFNHTDLLPYEMVTPRRREGLEKATADLDYVVPDPDLGWTIKPHGKQAQNGVTYAANAEGLRSAPTPMASTKPPGLSRVLVVGDSLAHGDDINWEETWVAQLDTKLGPLVEVWCGAVPGYGMDQALLRMQKLIPVVQPDHVILTIYRQNLLRNLTFFRSLQHPGTSIPWSKPRAIPQADGSLLVLNRPAVPPAGVEEVLTNYAESPLSKDDHFWMPELYTWDARYNSQIWRYLASRQKLAEFKERSAQFLEEGQAGADHAAALVQWFLQDMKQRGLGATILILPDEQDVSGLLKNAAPLAGFVLELQGQQLPVLDLTPVLVAGLKSQEGSEVFFVRGKGHPNGRACSLMAEKIAENLRAHPLGKRK